MVLHIAYPIIFLVIVLGLLAVVGVSNIVIDVPLILLASYFSYYIASSLMKIRRVKYYELKGEIAIALDDINKGKVGLVKVHGEIWKARALEDISKGNDVIIEGREGLILVIKKSLN